MKGLSPNLPIFSSSSTEMHCFVMQKFFEFPCLLIMGLLFFSKYFLLFGNQYILQISAGSLDAQHLLHMLYIDLYFLISKSANLSPSLRLFRFNGYQRLAVICPSNCSAPIPLPRGSPGIRRKMGVMKKDGALEKRVNLVIIQGGARKKYKVIKKVIRGPGQQKKSDFPEVAWEGWGQNYLTSVFRLKMYKILGKNNVLSRLLKKK